MRRGKLMSLEYLFADSLQTACKDAQLLTPEGKAMVSSHRFRHTVGTQLAERGARLHTIMSVLGHRSVSMSLVSAQISDREVLRDYESVLARTPRSPGAMRTRSAPGPSTRTRWNG